MGDRLGQHLGNYRLVKLLGKGGFAEVYLGQHVHLASKQAAIKILYLLDVDVHKFQEEAETTEKLVHPHIVRLLDFSIEQDIPFLVLDYAPSGSLRTRHPKGSEVPLATVGAYLKELAPALQYAHDQHILHRDIKPDNMLIGRQGELLLSDFGIAVLTQTGRTSTSAAYNIGGTPYYMAPETYQGKPVKESDQYSLAVVVYEWLCGRVPFSEGNFIQIGYQHAHEPVPPLRKKNLIIPLQVEAVIMKALAKEPKDRFGNVQAFAQAFEQAYIQAQQAEQARLRQAEEQENARLAKEERQPLVAEQSQRIEEERQRLAKEVEQARLAREERQRAIEDQPSPILSHRFPRAASPDVAKPPQGQNTLPLQAPPEATITIPQESDKFPSRPILKQPKRQRSPAVTLSLILLALILLGGIGFGIFTIAKQNTWTAQTSGTLSNLRGVAWSGSQFVAVGWGGTILVSSRGHSWTTQTSGSSGNLNSVAWSGSQFVAVGDNGIILASSDGHSWTTQVPISSSALYGVAWSGSQFVAVGDNGTILTSSNGHSWSEQTSGSSSNLQDVAWSGSQSVVVGWNGTILTSP